MIFQQHVPGQEGGSKEQAGKRESSHEWEDKKAIEIMQPMWGRGTRNEPVPQAACVR